VCDGNALPRSVGHYHRLRTRGVSAFSAAHVAKFCIVPIINFLTQSVSQSVNQSIKWFIRTTTSTLNTASTKKTKLKVFRTITLEIVNKFPSNLAHGINC